MPTSLQRFRGLSGREFLGMATLISVATLFKKQNGTLSITKDRKTVLWAPSAPAGASPTWQLPIADIANFQQSPAANPKPSVKFLVQRPGIAEPEQFIFRFVSLNNPAAEKEAVISVLSEIISALKKASGQPSTRDAPAQSSVSTPQPVTGNSSSDAAKDFLSDAT